VRRIFSTTSTSCRDAFAARGRIDVHVGAVDTGPQQRADLVIGVLVGGRDPRIAEEHAPETTSRHRWPTLILDTSCRQPV
jgi:hypothetical protein